MSDDPDEVLDRCLELLYEESPAEKAEGVNRLVSTAAKDPGFLADIAENHTAMAALARLLGDADSLPNGLTFNIVKLFLCLSLVEDFREMLSSHRVGALALDVMRLELDRARHREEQSLDTTQERVMHVCLCVLDNLADDLAAVRKMIKKGLLPLLVECIQQQQQSSDALAVALSLLQKASAFEETAVEMSSDGCQTISRLGRLLQTSDEDSHAQSIAVLFNLSFHEECASLISSANLHSTLVSLLEVPSLSAQTLQLLYHLSSAEAGQQKLLEAGIMSILTDRLQHAAANEGEVGGALAGLLVNMTLHPLGCEELVRLGAMDLLFRLTVVTDPASYVQIDNADDGQVAASSLYWEKHIWSSRVDLVIAQALDCVDNDLLVEWVGILSNLVDDLPSGTIWHDLLETHPGLLGLFQRLLDTCDDDLKLELIVWLGELCSSKDSGYWIASNNLVDVLNTVFIRQSSAEGGPDDEMMLQILLTYERLLMYEDTRYQVIGGDESSLAFAAERCLVLVEDFDRDDCGKRGEVADKILQRRYEQYAEEE
ncbi:hypothetical protein ACHAXT_009840 [Thalassiosira profunda]